MPTARGPMDVNMEAEPPFLEQEGLKLNRNLVRKVFSGDMAGTSEAQMIAAVTATPGSAGYVAIEHFIGAVAGRTGSLVLQHSGVRLSGGPATGQALPGELRVGVGLQARGRQLRLYAWRAQRAG